MLNTDAALYGGSGVGNLGAIEAVAEPWHGRPASATMTLPPLGVIWLISDTTEALEAQETPKVPEAQEVPEA